MPPQKKAVALLPILELSKMLKALATTYNGIRFNSRLESRWAYFMNGMSIAWEYEKEAYDLDGLTYVPDFWLPAHRAWLEIKGDLITDEIGLTVVRKCTKLAALSGAPVILAFNDPLNQKCAVFGKKGGFYPNSHFTVCRSCGAFGVHVRHLEETRCLCPNGRDCDPVCPLEIRQARRKAFDVAMAAKQHRFGISRKVII